MGARIRERGAAGDCEAFGTAAGETVDLFARADFVHRTDRPAMFWIAMERRNW